MDRSIKLRNLLITAAMAWVANYAFAADGDFDTSFDGDGIVVTDFETLPGEATEARAVIQQSDGKLVAIGLAHTTGVVTRYLPDGSLDNSFAGDGSATIDDGFWEPMDVIQQSDGKLVVSGGVEGDFALVRYRADGNLDDTFGTGGVVTTELGNDQSAAFAITQLRDGRLLAAGFVRWFDDEGGFQSDFILVRYLPNGSLDTSFGSDGSVRNDLSPDIDRINDVIELHDGTLLAVGFMGGYQGMGDNDQDIAIARYLPDGELDTTFGVDGLLRLGFISDGISFGADSATSVIQLDDDRLVIAGFGEVNGTSMVMFCLMPDGNLDTNFGNNGVASGPAGFRASVLVRQADGKLVLSGSRLNEPGSDYAWLRYEVDGSLDSSFGVDGMVVLPNPNTTNFNEAVSLIQQYDGKLVTALLTYGPDTNYNSNHFSLARIESGQLDTDADGYVDGLDVFPDDVSEWFDTDNDGVGNNTDTDDDDDGMLDEWEILYGLNPLVNDADDDLDGDGVNNGVDLFPADATQSGIDGDNDSFDNAIDNCPVKYNPDQFDTDSNGIGDACDAGNYDGDGFSNVEDMCYLVPSGGYEDFFGWYQWDQDNDQIGDECDPDIDNDSLLNASDNCPYRSNIDQLNTDGDTLGNACDSRPYDTDNDGYNDNADAFPNDPTEHIDTDTDGIGNNADPDDDNDNAPDEVPPCAAEGETCVFTGTKEVRYGAYNSFIYKTATDGIECSNDAFGDDPIFGYSKNCYLPGADVFPLDPTESADTDHDGKGDNSDQCPSQGNVYGLGIDANGCPILPPDTDGDGYRDNVDECPSQADVYGYGVDSTGCPILPPDADGDGYPDSVDICPNNGDQGHGVDGNGCPIPAPAKNDYNNDGIAGWIWKGQSNGVETQGQVWQLSFPLASTNFTTPVRSFLPNFLDQPNWELLTSGDFNKDGDADLLWRHKTLATWKVWQMQNGIRIAQHTPADFDLNHEWTVVGAGDTDKDGDDDVIFNNSTTGEVLVWEMQNHGVVNTHNIGTKAGYTLNRIGDFNKDGDVDLLFRENGADALITWELQANAFVHERSLFVTGSNYDPVCAGDFDNDGDDDIMFVNSTTKQEKWFVMENYSRTQRVGGTNTGFVFLGCGDYDGDGDADSLWQRSADDKNRVVLQQDYGTSKQTVYTNPFGGVNPGAAGYGFIYRGNSN